MEKSKCYENYPAWIVIVSNLLSISIYAIGAYLMFLLGVVWVFAYLAFIMVLEIRLMKSSCTRCYYYGKLCAFGRGKLCGALMKKSLEKLEHKKVTWKDLIVDFMVSLIPMIAGVALLVLHFEWLILLLVILMALLAFPGTGFVRGQLACRCCKQRELGCPAEKLFQKK